MLKKFFETARWEKAISTAVDKHINKGELKRMCTPELRKRMYEAIITGNYEIAPPHMALIPKDNGEYRTVYVNENIDRVFLSIMNDLLFEMYPHLVHPQCKSYQTGIGCGKVVQEASRQIVNEKRGFKADLSKYFDSVPIEFIDNMFDIIGDNPLIDVLRKYYHADLCFDTDGNLIEHYQSLKQGCAVASFLADALLYHIDEHLSELDGYYVRYSDDILFIGKDCDKAIQILKEELTTMGLVLNPKKVEAISDKQFFKFLGFSIKGSKISLSKGRLKDFQKEIDNRTFKTQTSYKRALKSVYKYLYVGDGTYSWATSVLPIVNCESDINELNKYVMDALRAVQTGKSDIGGLGYETCKPNGVVTRGKGKNVKANRAKTSAMLEGYKTIACMQKDLIMHRSVYETVVRCM